MVQRQLDIAIAKSEYKKIQLFIVALLVGFVLMFINFFFVEDTTSFFRFYFTPYYIVGWFLLFLGYELIAVLFAKEYLQRKQVVPDYLKIINVIIEASFPGFLLLVLTYYEKSAIFLDSPLLFFYFIIITLSSLNLDTRLTIIMGIVSSGGYLFVTYWAINNFDPDGEILDFPVLLYYSRSLFILMTAFGATFVANEIKKRHVFSFNVKSERDEMERLFDQQVSHEVVERLLEDNFSSKKHEVSILFLDIRNYSSFAENNAPDKVIEFQNKFFSPILGIIQEHQGITNQILGDGLMATFGAPIDDKEHAQHAFKAGVKIMLAVENLGIKGEIAETKIGIGLHTGNVVMGNIGNEYRKQFSISGEAVIISARLEQATKDYDFDFLVSKQIVEKIDVESSTLTALGQVKMKNISHQIEAYGVVVGTTVDN